MSPLLLTGLIALAFLILGVGLLAKTGGVWHEIGSSLVTGAAVSFAIFLLPASKEARMNNVVKNYTQVIRPRPGSTLPQEDRSGIAFDFYLSRKAVVQ